LTSSIVFTLNTPPANTNALKTKHTNKTLRHKPELAVENDDDDDERMNFNVA